MPLFEHSMRLPNGSKNKTMTHATEALYIHVVSDCNWCFSDPGGYFPVYPAANSLPPAGTLYAGTIWGPCIPTTGGAQKVTFNTSAVGTPCAAALDGSEHQRHSTLGGAHTITVS